MQAGDVYSLGLLIIEMASGESPWGMETPFQKAMDLAVVQKKRPPVPTFLSRSVRVSCLSNDRPSAGGSQDLMALAWLQ